MLLTTRRLGQAKFIIINKTYLINNIIVIPINLSSIKSFKIDFFLQVCCKSDFNKLFIVLFLYDRFNHIILNI